MIEGALFDGSPSGPWAGCDPVCATWFAGGKGRDNWREKSIHRSRDFPE